MNEQDSFYFKKFLTKFNPGSALVSFRNASIVSDNGLCSEIGRSILLKNGNAIDAAIATAICIGALNTHSSGIGGGFIMVIYNRFFGKCYSIDARETAPSNINSTFLKNSKNAFLGYKSIAVPGEVYGFWIAYKRFGSGRINWQNLITPTIQLLKNGYPVTKLMESSLEKHKSQILAEPTMKDFFVNKATNNLYKEGEILKNLKLAETLRRLSVSKDPIKIFYNGELAKIITDEISQKGGFITQKDFEKYEAIISESPLENSYFSAKNNEKEGNLVMCGAKTSSSFAVIQLIVTIMKKLFKIDKLNDTISYSSVDFYHKFIEAEKFAFALLTKPGNSNFVLNANEIIKNMTQTELIDEIVQKIQKKVLPTFQDYSINNKKIFKQQSDHGTSHISVIDSDGNAVSLTCSINNIFGAMVRSEETGIIWNNQMNDFLISNSFNFFGFKPLKANFIKLDKRPMSNMSPVIVYDKKTKDVKLNIGASGGSKIASAISQVIIYSLLFNYTIKEAIDMPRIYNHFKPFFTDYEQGFSPLIINGLIERGQNLTLMKSFFAIVHGIYRAKNFLLANVDYRQTSYTYPTGF